MLANQLLAFFLLQISSFVASSPVNTPRTQAPIHPAGEINADSQKVYVRFQIPGPGQTTNAARVTKLQWASTEGSVTATCKDFSNHGRRNDQLWLQYGLWSLQYTGLYQSPHMYGMTAQSGLDADNVAGMSDLLILAHVPP